jgi:parallel beta-helix repeat protein
MSKTVKRIIVGCALLTGLLGQTVYAATKVAVGPSACQPSLVHFSTIQAAVNAAPFNTIILVCPGTYPEQVVISQPLTLQGVPDGTGNAAVITVPAGNLVTNGTAALYGPVSAQLLVENTVGVMVSDIAIDGAGGTCAAGANREIGILFTNVGVPIDGTSAGKIQNVAVRNISNCNLGEGIVSDNSYLTIAYDSVHNVDLSCVNIGGGNNNISSNSIQGCVNGIVLNNSPASTLVSRNSLAALTYNGNGIYVNYGAAAQVTSNTIEASPGPLFYGILLYGSRSGTKAIGNKVSANGYGIVLYYSSNTTVQSNIVNDASLGIYDTYSFGGNIITKNIVNEANYGVFEFSPANDIFVPNSLYNVVVTVDPTEPTDPTAKGIDF